jgi:hypothetical protein
VIVGADRDVLIADVLIADVLIAVSARLGANTRVRANTWVRPYEFASGIRSG